MSRKENDREVVQESQENEKKEKALQTEWSRERTHKVITSVSHCDVAYTIALPFMARASTNGVRRLVPFRFRFSPTFRGALAARLASSTRANAEGS